MDIDDKFQRVEVRVPKHRGEKKASQFDLYLTPFGWSNVANIQEFQKLRKDVFQKALFRELSDREFRDAVYWTKMKEAWG